MYDLLKQHIRKHISSVSEQEIESFCQLFEKKTLQKKDFLLKQGEICLYETFVTKGLLRYFHSNPDGEEQTIYFGGEDWWFGDLDSFANQTPSELNIQALEDAELLVISYEKKEYAFAHFPFVEKLFRKITQKSYFALQRRMVDNLSKTADERYLDYIEKYPHIVRRLSNIQIASYLGISPESLSRIKKKIFKKV